MTVFTAPSHASPTGHGQGRQWWWGRSTIARGQWAGGLCRICLATAEIQVGSARPVLSRESVACPRIANRSQWWPRSLRLASARKTPLGATSADERGRCVASMVVRRHATASGLSVISSLTLYARSASLRDGLPTGCYSLVPTTTKQREL